jgi:integrase
LSAPITMFESPPGGPYDPHHLHQRVLAPACEEASVEWAGFDTFRHMVASRMFAADRNVVQVQHWLGRHAASFTLDTYGHLLDEDLGEPLKPVQVGARSAPRQEEPQTTGNGLYAVAVAAL